MKDFSKGLINCSAYPFVSNEPFWSTIREEIETGLGFMELYVEAYEGTLLDLVAVVVEFIPDVADYFKCRYAGCGLWLQNKSKDSRRYNLYI